MKILYLSGYYKPANVYGGPTRSIANLCEGMVRNGAQVTVFTTNANGSARLQVPLSQPVQVNDVEVWYFPLSVGGSYFFAPELGKTVHRCIPDFDFVALEGFWFHALLPVATACPKAGVPFIISLRGNLLPEALKIKPFKKAIYLNLVAKPRMQKAAAFHCTDEIEVGAPRAVGLKPPTFVVPNSVDIRKYADLPQKGGFRNEYSIPQDALLLLFLGRLKTLKRPDIVIDVTAAARSEGRNVHAAIVGPDEDGLVGGLKNQAARLGCLDRVHFTGLLSEENLPQVFADSDLFLMPTELQENFGMSAVEAMAAGVPLLVSNWIPVGRWAVECGAGRLAEANSADFIQVASEMLSNPQKLNAMGEKGRQLARQKFDNESVARQMLAQFESILKTGHPITSYKNV